MTSGQCLCPLKDGQVNRSPGVSGCHRLCMVSHWQRGKTHRVQVSPGHGIMELSCSGESVVVRGPPNASRS